MSDPFQNPPSLLTLPSELIQTILELVIGDPAPVHAGYYGFQQTGGTIRRVLANTAPGAGDSTLFHPLRLTNRQLGNELQAFYNSTRRGSLTLDPLLRTVPPGVFQGVRNVSLNMQQALSLQVIIPFLPLTHQDPAQPNTFLRLAGAPSVQSLEIYWTLPFLRGEMLPFGQNIPALLARLRYFRRSFRVVIHVEATEFRASTGRREVVARGTLMDHESGWIYDSANRPELNHSFTGRMRDLDWTPRVLRRTMMSIRRAAVIEASPQYQYLPLGFVWPTSIIPFPTGIPLHPVQPPPYDD